MLRLQRMLPAVAGNTRVQVPPYVCQPDVPTTECALWSDPMSQQMSHMLG